MYNIVVNLFNIFGPPALAGRVLWNMICPSFRLSGRFLGIISLVLAEFLHDARNPYKVVREVKMGVVI